MRKTLVIFFLSAITVAICGVFHYYHWYIGHWTRLLIAIPILYTGVNYRRTESIALSYILLVCHLPFVFMEANYSMKMTGSFSWGVQYLIAIIAAAVIAVNLAHIIRKQKEDAAAMMETRRIIERLQKTVSQEKLEIALKDIFKKYGQTEHVELCLADDAGTLVRGKGHDAEPLPDTHLYYAVMRSGACFSSIHLSGDERVRIAHGGDSVDQLTVFPLNFGGRPRGVIALADSQDQNFGQETISILDAVKHSVERVLEINEAKRNTIEKELMEARIRDTFSSYISRNVAESILQDTDNLELGGVQQDVTVMFTEVVNFDKLLAELDPEELLSMLNQYLSIAIDAVFEFDGTLDKFIEDNVMAFWGAPLPMFDTEERALRCALKMQKLLAGLNDQWRAQGKPTFEICIGINAGPAIAGNIGSIRRMEYTVIGDTVNLASRIKTLSKKTGARVLVSESVKTNISSAFTVRNEFSAQVKGKAQKIKVYEILAS